MLARADDTDLQHSHTDRDGSRNFQESLQKGHHFHATEVCMRALSRGMVFLVVLVSLSSRSVTEHHYVHMRDGIALLPV